MKSFFVILLLFLTSSLKSQNSTMEEHTYTNSLIHETSPYLLQHAHNPVNWYAWGEEALNKAKEENKPIIISIGYSSCHWCHVMEHESFEDPEVAEVMNELYVCIKIDREERPDIDQIYMDALNSMGLGGGWPLNAITTPDGKPFYGGTYFPKNKWVSVLKHLSKTYHEKTEDIKASADKVTHQLNMSEMQRYGMTASEVQFTPESLEELFEKLRPKFDMRHGGMQNAPKFPMPSLWKFLLRYYDVSNNELALKHITHTLDKMALGGLYDQVGGGFTRYSTDEEWFAPHFEKMLYDNGQLISLYSEAFALTQSKLYEHTVYQSLEFISREMTSDEGGFYSALDADSEGEEGKFYTWTHDELIALLGEDFDLFKKLYNIQKKGNWEERNILHRFDNDENFATENHISTEELREKIKKWETVLLKEREKRIRPGLDDKILLSWNAIMMKGYIDAYRVFDEEKFLQAALRNAEFIETKMRNGDGYFHTYKNSVAKIDGYMDDYAHLCAAYIDLYQATFDEEWLVKADSIAKYTLDHFFDEEEQMFFYTSSKAEKLIARKKELFDDVMPGSNSVMATNLYLLSLYFDQKDYRQISDTMVNQAKSVLFREPYFLSNWGTLYTMHIHPTAEVVIVGNDYQQFRKELDQVFIPNKIYVGAQVSGSLPLLVGRESDGTATTIYVCQNHTCQLPVHSVEKALRLIEKNN